MTLSSDSGPSKRLKTRSSLRSNTKPKPVVIKFSCHKPKNSSSGTTNSAGMAIRAVEFSNGEYKIRKIFA